MADVYRARVYNKYFLEYRFYFSIYTSEQQMSGVFTLLCDRGYTTYDCKCLTFVSNLQQAA